MLSFRSLQTLAVRGKNVMTSQITCVRHMKGYQRPMLYVMQAKRKQLEFQSIYGIKPTPRYEFTDWNYNAELYAFGKRLGENFDDRLLRIALTDPSFIIKQMKEQEALNLADNVKDLPDNTALSAEGTTLLQNCIYNTLRMEYPKLPEEGIRAILDFLVSVTMLSNLSSLIGTRDMILCQEYPPGEETFANAFRAIIAVLSKSSGLNRANKFIQDIVLTQLSGLDLFDIWQISHPWSKLCHSLKEQGKGTPEPRLISQAGPSTILSAYIVGLYDDNKVLLGKGYGETVEIALEMAALDTLRDMYGIRRPSNGLKFLNESSYELPQRLVGDNST